MEIDLRGLILDGIGEQIGSRVTWSERPQGGSLPAVVLWLVSQSPEYTLKGPEEIVLSRVQADCWSDSFGSAKETARALIGHLSGYHGDFGSTRFDGIFQASARDMRDGSSGTSGSDTADRFFRSSVDFIINHRPKG